MQRNVENFYYVEVSNQSYIVELHYQLRFKSFILIKFIKF